MRSAALIVALLVLACLPVVPATATVGEEPGAAQVDQQGRITPLSTDIVVSLRPNGSARWTVTVTYGLDTDTEQAAFDAYRSEFESGTAPGLNADLFETLAAEGSQSTNRPMRIQNVDYRTALDGEEGSLTLAFTWTNFLERPDEETLRFHDAVLLSEPNPEGRLWLSTLDENQTMTIRTPPGYNVNTTQAPSFEFENNSVVIEGPQEFDGDLTITYQRTAPVSDDTPWALIAVAVILGIAVVVAAVVIRRRDGNEPAPSPAEPPADDDRGGPGSPTGAETVADGADGTDDEDEVDLSLLSDEERVERLLERNGGRMKQASIVRETGWSDAKVSQLLSSMAERGRVEKLRLGRENLISIPEDDSDE